MKEEIKVKRSIRPTTFAQRRLMIETYQKTHNIEQGIEGIRWPKKHIRKNLGRVPEKYACRVIELKKKNPNWGRRTIASVIVKENNNKKVISPGGVQKVLERAGLWNKTNL